MDSRQNIIIYRTSDGKASVALYATDGKVWLNQQQMAELFATSKPNISMHISNILKDKELAEKSVVKKFLTTIYNKENIHKGALLFSFHPKLAPLKAHHFRRTAFGV